jgi:hypothetical protein
MGPKWVPDTKTDRPMTAGHNINSTQLNSRSYLEENVAAPHLVSYTYWDLSWSLNVLHL